MDSLKHLLARRSTRIVVLILVAAALLYVALLSVEGSGPSPLHSYNSSHSGTTATTAATNPTTNGNNQGTNGNNQGQNCNNNSNDNNQGRRPRCPSGS